MTMAGKPGPTSQIKHNTAFQTWRIEEFHSPYIWGLAATL